MSVVGFLALGGTFLPEMLEGFPPRPAHLINLVFFRAPEADARDWLPKALPLTLNSTITILLKS